MLFKTFKSNGQNLILTNIKIADQLLARKDPVHISTNLGLFDDETIKKMRKKNNCDFLRSSL